MQNQESRSLLEKRLLGIAGEVAFVVDSEYWIEKVIENGRNRRNARNRRNRRKQRWKLTNFSQLKTGYLKKSITPEIKEAARQSLDKLLG